MKFVKTEECTQNKYRQSFMWHWPTFGGFMHKNIFLNDARLLATAEPFVSLLSVDVRITALTVTGKSYFGLFL